MINVQHLQNTWPRERGRLMLLCQVHDELLLECDETSVAFAVDAVRAAMTDQVVEVLRRDFQGWQHVPLVVTAKGKRRSETLTAHLSFSSASLILSSPCFG